MKPLFDAENLFELAQSRQEDFRGAEPFPHIVLDNFLSEDIVRLAHKDFPTVDSLDYYKYDNPLEKKLAFDQVGLLPESIQTILHSLHTPVFLRFLEVLTGIDGLIPDPYFRGGGVHQIVPGGKLDVHLDFNHYQKLNLERRLNVLLYLNPDWKPEYGGNFELWRGKHLENNQHDLSECVGRVAPLFNRLVVFRTSEISYHGHPEPLQCPEGMTRKSLAWYFYSVTRPEEEFTSPHSTVFLKRPEDPNNPEIDTLREKRNQGRLSSNVNNKFVAK